MTISTIRPDGTPSGGSSFTVTAAASANAALADNSDASYIRKAASGTASVILNHGSVSISSAQIVRQVRVRARCAGGTTDTKANLYLGTRVEAVNYFTGAVPLRGNAAIGEIAGPWQALAPDGQSWDQDRITAARAQWTDYRDNAARAYLYEVYIDVDLATQPSTDATAPLGTLRDTSLPDVSWTYTDSEGEAQAYYRARVYAPSAYLVGGFDPEIGVPVWDSGVVASVDTTATVGEFLANSTYRVYVKTAKTVNGSPFWSAWDFSEFTVNLDKPPMPSIEVAYNAGEGAVVCTVTGWDAVGYDSQTFDVERSDDQGSSWLAVRNGSGLIPSGTYTALVKDYEAPRGVSVLYRARAVGSVAGNEVASSWGGFRPWDVISKSAVFYIDAAESEGQQRIGNLGTGGSVLDAQQGSVDSGLRVVPDDGYVYLPGIGGNYLSTPDAAALDITGDLDLRVRVALDDWTPAAITTLIAKYQTNTTRSYLLDVNTDGTLRLTTSADGSAVLRTSSTVATGITDGAVKWVRATIDVNDGAGGRVITFYTSDDGVTWTTLGSPVTTAGTTSIFSSTSILEVGAATTGTQQMAAGKFYRAQVLNGIGGTVVLDVDCTSAVIDRPQFVASTGQVITINNSGRDSNDPVWLRHDGSNYVYLPGVSGNFLSVPDSAGLDITGDLDLRAYVALDDWTPAPVGRLVAKYGAVGDRAYMLDLQTTGVLRLTWSADGSTLNTISSTVATGVPDGAAKWVRATLDADNGAGGNDIRFFLSDDGTTWTQLGTTVTTAGIASIVNSAAPVAIGSDSAGGATLAGQFYRAQVYNGIGGTKVLDVDTSVITTGSQTTFTALTGQTVTINRSTSGRKAVAVVHPVWLLGTDDFLEVPDNDLIDFGATDSFTIVAVVRQWATAVNNAYYLSKRSTAGWALTHSGTALTPQVIVDNGPIAFFRTTPTYTEGALSMLTGVLDRTASTVRGYMNATAGGTTSTTALGSIVTSDLLLIGKQTNASVFQDFELLAVAVFRRALTASEISTLSTGFANPVNAFPSLAVPNDGAWWMKVPTIPALTVAGVRVLADPDVQAEAQVGVFRPIGRDNAIVIDGGLGGWDGTYRLLVSGDAEWQAIETLIRSRVTVLVQDPFGYQKWVRFTGRSMTIDGTPSAPRRLVDVTYVEVDS